MYPHRIVIALTIVGVAASGPACAEPQPTDYPAAAREQFERAEELFTRKQYADALKAYTAAADRGMRDFRLLRLHQGDCFTALKNYRKAVETDTDIIKDGALGRLGCLR